MDFPPNDDMNIEEDMDDSSGSCETVQDFSCNHETTIKGQVLRGVSKSLPIQSSSKSSQLLEICTPTSTCNQASKSNQRALSTPCLISSTGTPSSPSSSLIPRILRESFSKFLNRRDKILENDPAYSDTEYPNDEVRDSECSTISPATAEIVAESLRNKLPIIPFAYPSSFTMGRYQEDTINRMRKNSLTSLKRSFSEGRCIDYFEVFEEED